MSQHTADTCTIETHDHFGQREAYENGTGRPPLGCSDELLCGDCARRMFYDYADENYHHLVDPEVGCFLIPSEIDGPVSWSGPSSIVQQEHR